MTSLYEILKASKGVPVDDMYTALFGRAVGGGSGASEIEYTGSVPVAIKTDGSPISAYRISGNMQQTGTPTPESPIQPEETGEKTANLFDDTTATLGKYIDNNGNEQTSSATLPTQQLNHSDYFPVLPNSVYTFSSVKDSSVQQTVAFVWYTSEKSFISRTTEVKTTGTTSYSLTATAPNNAGYAIINYTSANNEVMLNTGSTALPYEPYGYKLPVLSGGVTTPIYLGEVESTRKIKKLVLTGEETVAGSAVTGGWIITNLSDSINNTTGMQTSYCSHYLSKNNGAMSSLSQGEMCISTQVNNRINFVTTFATAEDFKSYLAAQYAAGTPVTVWYVLATPTTGIVNEPIRKIGDYADTVSMEQAQVTIPTINGEQTFDVQTTLKPSEVYIKYKGEA